MTHQNSKARVRLIAALVRGFLGAPIALSQTSPVPERPVPTAAPTRVSGDLQDRLVPGMADYTNRVLFGDVWLCPVETLGSPKSGAR